MPLKCTQEVDEHLRPPSLVLTSSSKELPCRDNTIISLCTVPQYKWNLNNYSVTELNPGRNRQMEMAEKQEKMESVRPKQKRLKVDRHEVDRLRQKKKDRKTKTGLDDGQK